MAVLYLVRHGKPAAGFGEDLNPGLDATGRGQADALAERLAPLGPLPILTSPLARCRETAAPLAARWGVEPVIERKVAEIPTSHDTLEERARWLADFMRDRWDHTFAFLRGWRDGLLERLRDIDEDTVVFTHFIAINVAVGRAVDDTGVVVFRPDNCSVTRMSNDGRRLEVLERGHEAETRIV